MYSHGMKFRNFQGTLSIKEVTFRPLEPHCLPHYVTTSTSFLLVIPSRNTPNTLINSMFIFPMIFFLFGCTLRYAGS